MGNTKAKVQFDIRGLDQLFGYLNDLTLRLGQETLEDLAREIVAADKALNNLDGANEMPQYSLDARIAIQNVINSLDWADRDAPVSLKNKFNEIRGIAIRETRYFVNLVKNILSH